jgi:hypothetical protein
MACDTTSDFKLINRTAISRFNEPNFDSANGNLDELTYAVTDKVIINDGSTAVSGTTKHTGSYTKTGGNSLYHAASQTTARTVTLYSQNFSAINAANYAGSNAYLHMWVYVEDMTSSIWSGYITLKGTNGNLTWSTICYITHNGWNELWLPLSGTSTVVKSGSFTGLTITDYRSDLVQHSDYYFDDIYLCHANVADDKPMSTVSSYPIAPTPTRIIPSLPSNVLENGDIVVLTGDSLKGNLARPNWAHVIHDPAFVKEGVGAWYMQKIGWLACPVYLPTTDISSYMSNGYVHLWVYVEDASALTGMVELTSSGTHDSDEISWSIEKYLTQDGWNELRLPLNNPDATSGTFDATKLNYFRLYLHSKNGGNVSVVLDDVRIADDTDTISFDVLSDEEADYLIDDPRSYTNTVARYADHSAGFIYAYELRHGLVPTSIQWSANTSGQLLLSVSTDRITWKTVYQYTGEASDSGLSKATRTYDLTQYLDVLDTTTGKLYIKIADAYPTSDWGGAVNNASPVTLTVAYSEKATTLADRIVETVTGTAIHANTLGAIPGGLVEVVNKYMTSYEELALKGPLTTFQTNGVAIDKVMESMGYTKLSQVPADRYWELLELCQKALDGEG